MDVPTTDPVQPARLSAVPTPDCADGLAEALRRLRCVEDDAAELGLDRVANRAAALHDLLERLFFPSTPGAGTSVQTP